MDLGICEGGFKNGAGRNAMLGNFTVGVCTVADNSTCDVYLWLIVNMKYLQILLPYKDKGLL